MLLATLSGAQMASVFGKRAQRIYALLEPSCATRAFYTGGPGNLSSLDQAMEESGPKYKPAWNRFLLGWPDTWVA
jgi:hypothetical protein